jgi:hypothetical protein
MGIVARMGRFNLLHLLHFAILLSRGGFVVTDFLHEASFSDGFSEAFDTRFEGTVNGVRCDDDIPVGEVRWVGVIGVNATHFGRGHNDHCRFVLSEISRDRLLVAEIDIAFCGC